MFIFEMMDEQKIGVLSCENITTKNLPENILNLYLPIIAEIDEFKETINFEEFLIISEKILSVSDSNYLY